MKRLLLASLASITLLAGAPVLAKGPTVHQVYEAVQAGRLGEAQSMMDQVLREHPDSAQAHYVEAEILVRQARIGEAADELRRAEKLAPGLPFARPEAVQELRTRIVAGASSRPAPALGLPQAPSGFPWGVVLVVLGAGLVIALIVRARRPAVVPAPYSPSALPGGPGAPISGYGAPTPMAPVGGGLGSGIMGGLVTGAAVGAGMVAGEALAHELMDGHSRGHEATAAQEASPALADNDLGGPDFGINDAGSWDDAGMGGGQDGWG